MAEMTAREATEILLNLSWMVGTERRSQIAALIEQQAQEIERMNGCLKFEQNYLSRVGTHAEGCYKWGPKHWDCAMQEIERLAPVITAAREYDTICTQIHAMTEPIPGYMLDVARKARLGLSEALMRMDAASSSAQRGPAGEDAP